MLSCMGVTGTEKRMENLNTGCSAKGMCAWPACLCCGPVGGKSSRFFHRVMGETSVSTQDVGASLV